MPRSAKAFLLPVAAALALGAAAGCTPLEVGVGAAALGGPQAVTGRNSFYWLDKTFGRSCSDTTYFDRPVRCVNDRS